MQRRTNPSIGRTVEREVRPQAPRTLHPQTQIVPPVSGATRPLWALDADEAEDIVRRTRRRRRPEPTQQIWCVDAAAAERVLRASAADEEELVLDVTIELPELPSVPPAPSPTAPLRAPRRLKLRAPPIPWVMRTPTAHHASLSDAEAFDATARPISRFFRAIARCFGF